MLSPFLLNNSKLKVLSSGLKNSKGCGIFGQKVARFKGGSTTKHSIVKVDLQRTFLPHKALVLNFIKTYRKTCLIALIKYSTGSYSYIPTPYGIEVGSFLKTIFKPIEFSRKYMLGYLVLLKYLEPHTVVFNLEIKIPFGGRYALAGGTSAVVLVIDKFSNQVLVQLPTGTKIWIDAYCSAVLGRSSNIFNHKKVIGKAGMSANYNLRPIVRGVAKNPVDHPHGGRTKTNSPEVTPWNKIAKKNK